MFKGNQTHTKLEVIIYIVHYLLLNRRLEPKHIVEKFNISEHTLIRYIATIKNSLADFGIYYIDIYFDRKYSVYRCNVNE